MITIVKMPVRTPLGAIPKKGFVRLNDICLGALSNESIAIRNGVDPAQVLPKTVAAHLSERAMISDGRLNIGQLYNYVHNHENRAQLLSAAGGARWVRGCRKADESELYQAIAGRLVPEDFLAPRHEDDIDITLSMLKALKEYNRSESMGPGRTDDFIKLWNTNKKILDSKGRLIDLSGLKPFNTARFYREIDLAGADLRGADIDSIYFQNSTFAGADLRDITAKHAQFGGDLSRAKLGRGNFELANLGKTDLVSAHAARALFAHANLRFSNLTNAVFTFSNMTYANLFRAVCTGADFCQADLESADLGEADAHNALFVGAKLVESNLEWANLNGVNMRGADLNDVKTKGASFWGADLRDTKNTASAEIPKQYVLLTEERK